MFKAKKFSEENQSINQALDCERPLRVLQKVRQKRTERVLAKKRFFIQAAQSNPVSFLFLHIEECERV